MMNILITGMTGFIGLHIATDLHAAGHSITGCARNIAYTKIQSGSYIAVANGNGPKAAKAKIIKIIGNF